MVLKRNEDLHLEATINASLNVSTLSRNITKQSELVTDLSELKNDVETGMYFDSSIPQGYGVEVVAL
jgi:mevalonate kinase